MLTDFSQGASRILSDDRLALRIAVGLVAGQIALAVTFALRTRRPLWSARTKVLELASELPKGLDSASKIAATADKRIQEAWAAVFTTRSYGLREDPAEAFDAARLEPTSYRHRLDAAAPGIFTAVGIIGTFVGLILGFLRVDASDASGSVSPLLGAMVVAFGNSLVGVSLSVVWSICARWQRHRFADACHQLVAAARRLARPETFERQLLDRLEALTAATIDGQRQSGEQLVAVTAALHALQEENRASSERLLNNLSASVGEAFRGMIRMPFDQLQNSVVQFDEVVKATSQRHAEIQHHFESAAARLQDAETRLADGIQAARECVEEFGLAAIQLREGTTTAGTVVEQARLAAQALEQTIAEVRHASDRYEHVSNALASATGSMELTSASMGQTADRFASSTTELERALATIREASDETVEHSVAAVRRELDESIRLLVDGVRQSGQETAAAYEASSMRLTTEVDRKMSDLTDRLSAELTTLADRLPDHVDSLNNAMKQIRDQVRTATRSMDSAVNQLAQRAPEAMQKQFDLYDKALAEAMDHFNGTLSNWDAKVSAIETLATELGRFTQAMTPTLPSPQVAIPS